MSRSMRSKQEIKMLGCLPLRPKVKDRRKEQEIKMLGCLPLRPKVKDRRKEQNYTESESKTGVSSSPSTGSGMGTLLSSQERTQKTNPDYRYPHLTSAPSSPLYSISDNQSYSPLPVGGSYSTTAAVRQFSDNTDDSYKNDTSGHTDSFPSHPRSKSVEWHKTHPAAQVGTSDYTQVAIEGSQSATTSIHSPLQAYSLRSERGSQSHYASPQHRDPYQSPFPDFHDNHAAYGSNLSGPTTSMLSLKPVTGEYGNHIHNSPAQHELHFKSQVANFQARNNTGLKSFDDIVNDLFDWKQAYDAMKCRLENAERALEKHSLVDTGMYKGDATPALLQRRADAVKFDIQMCAAAISEFAEINSFPVESPSHLKRMIVPFDHLEGAKKLQLTRMLLEASLCEFMFQGFESANYSITLDGNTCEVFDTPTALKRRRLQLFNHFFQEDPQKMQERNDCFRMFCQLKISTVIESLFSELVRSHDRFREIAEDGTRKEFPCQNYLSRLAKSVWLLHKVAFSFEPASAEIFRVPPSSCFAKEYMQEEEDIRPTLSCDERERKVAFMTVPGFTLRNSVIKAYVCCVDSLIG